MKVSHEQHNTPIFLISMFNDKFGLKIYFLLM